MLENPALGRYFPTLGLNKAAFGFRITISEVSLPNAQKFLKMGPNPFLPYGTEFFHVWSGHSGIWLSDMRGITLGKADAIAPRRRRMLPQPLANDLRRAEDRSNWCAHGLAQTPSITNPRIKVLPGFFKSRVPPSFPSFPSVIPRRNQSRRRCRQTRRRRCRRSCRTPRRPRWSQGFPRRRRPRRT